MEKIKFGTDGWRALTADSFTVPNVRRVGYAVAKWLSKTELNQKVVIGYDTRFGSKMFAEETARIIVGEGIEVIISDDIATTPMVSLATVKYSAGMGVVITASHNPYNYNGFKIKSSVGGPSIPSEIAEVEELIPDHEVSPVSDLNDLIEDNKIKYENFTDLYISHVKELIDISLIRKSPLKIGYDAMYGAGQKVMKKLFPEHIHLHSEINYSFNNTPPEPILKNLSELEKLMKERDELDLGIATDGDADRIALFDEHGVFIDSHHILLLLLYYKGKIKDRDGKVIITFSVTDKMVKLAEVLEKEYEIVPIGFKYIAEIMRDNEVIVGGEESGGLAIEGHIPERDGIFIALTLLEYMAETGSSLSDLIHEIYGIVGPFAYKRDDLYLTEEKKKSVLSRCAKRTFKKIGSFEIEKTEDLDGYKFYFGDGKWLLIRPSGTEPVLRMYAQAQDAIIAEQILKEAHEDLIK